MEVITKVLRLYDYESAEEIEFSHNFTNLYIYGRFKKTHRHNSSMTNLFSILSNNTTNIYNLNISGQNYDKLAIELPHNLQSFNCSGNKLQYLPNLPSTLLILECQKNSLVFMVPLPPQLVEFNCGNNNLIELPELSSTLLLLKCEKNKLIELPDRLPPRLKELICFKNKLVKLPDELPLELEILECGANDIHLCPVIPKSIKILCINSTLITELHLSLELLQLVCINCNNTSITDLGVIPPNLRELHCNNTLIIGLPDELPESLKILNCNSSTSVLSLFPNMYNIARLDSININLNVGIHPDNEELMEMVYNFIITINDMNSVKVIINNKEYNTHSFSIETLLVSNAIYYDYDVLK